MTHIPLMQQAADTQPDTEQAEAVAEYRHDYPNEPSACPSRPGRWTGIPPSPEVHRDGP